MAKLITSNNIKYMSRLFIFAIGGTGCRVLRSLNFLLASGMDGMDDSTEIFPIIIDYDKENGDKTLTLECLKNYCNVRKSAYHGINDFGGGNEYFAPHIRQMKDLEGGKSTFELNYSPSNADKQFRDNIGYDTINNRTSQFFLESLYDDSINSATTELNIDMTVGFKGNPNIGSVIFHELKDKPEYKEFLNIFDAQTDRIMIVGSLFGGTGSSGIPELIMAMRDKKAVQKIKEAVIGCLMVLPYFSLQDQAGSPIHANLFNSKTKAALSYYKTSGINTKFNSIYYVGDRIPSQIEHHIGGREQRNPANICELIGAMSIIHFFRNQELSSGLDRQTNYYKYAFGGNIYGDQSRELNLSDFMKDDHTAYMFDALNSLTMALKYFSDIIENDKKQLKNVSYYDQIGFNSLSNWTTPSSPESTDDNRYLQNTCYYLHNFYSLYKEWLDELKNPINGHQVNFYNLKNTGPNDNYGFHHLFVHKDQVNEKNAPTFNIKDFERELNNALQDRGHYVGRTLRQNVRREYAFMDILRVACDTILHDNTKINI